MKVNIDISAEYKEPFAVIHTDKVTAEIQRAVDMLGTNETPVTAFRNEEDIVVLKPDEIYMVRVEDGDTIIYGAKSQYRSRAVGKQVHADIKDHTGKPLIYGQHRTRILGHSLTEIKERKQGLCFQKISSGV